MKKLYLLIAVLFSFVTVYGFWPRLVYEHDLTLRYPKIIKNPEISQGFYGELKEDPDYYKIIAEEEFDLYLNIMAPDVEDAWTDFSVGIYGDNKTITLEGDRFEWENYYDRTTENRYLKGPTYEETLEKGEYLIQVYNEENEGKYVMVIGDKPYFSPKEVITYILVQPKLKGFFERPLLSAFYNRVGIYLLITLFILLLIIGVIILLIQRLSIPSYRPL